MRTIFLDIIFVLSGVILAPWATFRWGKLGFRLEPKFFAGNRDGSFFLIVALIGVALAFYGLFDLFVIKRKKN